MVLVATRSITPILDAQSRAIASQIGFLIVLNLVLGFSGFFNVDNFAHVGGLLAGLWLGLVFPPSQVADAGVGLAVAAAGDRTASDAGRCGSSGVVALLVVSSASGRIRHVQVEQDPELPGRGSDWPSPATSAAAVGRVGRHSADRRLVQSLGSPGGSLRPGRRASRSGPAPGTCSGG